MARREDEFTLILSGIDELTDEILDRLYKAGCDDALLGVRDGIVFADFAREAQSLTEPFSRPSATFTGRKSVPRSSMSSPMSL